MILREFLVVSREQRDGYLLQNFSALGIWSWEFDPAGAGFASACQAWHPDNAGVLLCGAFARELAA